MTPQIDLTEAWKDCLEEATLWTDDREVIWQDDAFPERLEKFLSILKEFLPAFLEKPDTRKQLQQIYDAIMERVTIEENVYYGSPRSDNDAEERAKGYDGLHKNFAKLAAFPIWSEHQQNSLKNCASHFWSEAQSLWEDLPQEPDHEGEQAAGVPAELDINQLFSDL